MRNRRRIAAGICAIAIGGASVDVSAETLVSVPFKGVTHYQITETVPRPLVIDLLEINLADPDLTFFTNPSNGAAADETNKLKTTAFVSTYNLEVGINGGFFNTAAVNGDLNSIAVSNGTQVSPWAGNGDMSSQFALNITQNNFASVVRPVDYDVPDIAIRESTSTTPLQAWTTVAGNRRILNAGTAVTTNDANGAVNRTAVGVNQAKTKLFLMTVDGRQPGYSEGMTQPEVANLLKSYGAHYALNFDGGGSTTMAFADRSATARLINTPSDSGGERTVANSLGLHAMRLPQWNVNASGNWTDAANWVNGIPNAIDAAAHFKGAIGSNRTVTLNGDKTAGRVTFDDAQRYTLSGATLKMDISGAGTAKIDVLQATHHIDSTIQLIDSLDIQVASGGTLRTAGITNLSGKTINKTGLGTLTINSGTQTHAAGATLIASAGVVNLNTNAGTANGSANLVVIANAPVNFASRQDLASLNVGAQGSVVLAAGGDQVVATNAVSITPGGKVDLTDNAMVVRASSLAAVSSLIKNGYNNGIWLGSGIQSTSAANDPTGLTALGFASNADAFLSDFAGVTNLDNNDVLIKYTYLGDSDLNGVTNLDDFPLFIAGLDNASLPQTWAYGDYDYSGDVNLDDFPLFIAGLEAGGTPLSQLVESIENATLSADQRQAMLTAIAAVPEPAGVALLGLAACGLWGRRRR